MKEKRVNNMETGRVKETIKKRAIQKRIKTHRPEVLFGADRKSHTVHLAPDQNGENVCLFSDTVSVPVRLLEQGRADYIKVQLNDVLNHVRTDGAKPAVMTGNILLPENTEEPCLRFFVDCLEEVAQREQMELADINAECSPDVKNGLFFLTVTGKKKQDTQKGIRAFLPGTDLVMLGTTAAEGCVMLENAGRELLLERFSKRFLEKFKEYPDMTLAKEALDFVLEKEPEAGIYCIGRSGVFGALWEISSASGKGFSVDLSKIPVFQETIEICEFFDVNPYMLRSGGALLAAVKNGRSLVDSCSGRNIPAAVIGTMEHHADKAVFNGEERRYLDMPSAVKIGQNIPEGLAFLY